jgi:hypothetical protein
MYNLVDRIEDVFKVKPDNQYEKIIDETYNGKYAYFGNID